MTEPAGVGRRMEILAPAGDAEMLRAAVFSGADCVYLGVKGFNARRSAANFEGDALAEAVAFCHTRNCRVYAAVNTLVLPGREREFENAVAAVVTAGCDAIIVQDLAAVPTVRGIAPGLDMHASTQMSVHSLAGVQKLAELGFSRVILARELSEAELAYIAAHSPIELEIFLHGALCVGVSGQCLMSAFLGGRSANRGACAGPCRLPFVAGTGPQQPGAAPQGRHELSLKDLSLMEALPRLQRMGIASVKIEGRLRGPEYCAVVVDSARKALNNEEYNEELLQDVFSRSGFTDGWFAGKITADMFGARTEQDTAAAKRALPRARALYRREMPRVPVEMELRFGPHGGQLVVADGTHTVRRRFGGPLPAAEQDNAGALMEALGKTGGTPFYLGAPPLVDTGGAYLPAAEAGRLRKDALEELLEKRQARSATRGAPAAASVAVQRARQAREETGRPLLRGRFAHVAQMPQNAPELCDTLLFPLEEWEQVPPELRPKSWLWLPRVLFGPAENVAARQIEQTKALGFAGYEAQNIAHWKLCEGLPMTGGFGLNVTNARALMMAAAMGCGLVTLSVELSLAQMRDVAEAQGLNGAVATDAIAYGHLPLMVTRACPLMRLQDCAKCPGEGWLADRKGVRLPVVCRDGVRHILNPVPLWMADRLEQLATDCATLYFTQESREQAADVVQAYAEGRPAPGAFTRGLYTKGTEG